MDKVLLIDGHNSIWRASIVFGGKQEEDQDESAIIVFNFFRNLRPIIEMFSPDKCFFVLEGHPQFRYDLFSDYKANRIVKLATRKNDLDKFKKAKDIIIDILKSFQISICRADKYEADDVVATLCDDMKDENITVLSNDSDYIQLLQRNYSNIGIYNPIKKEYMVSPPYPYVAWKSLAGDKSDNIPGLLKPKKALNTISDPVLFNKFLEIEENRANFNINRQLIEFRYVPLEEIQMVEGKKDFKTVKEMFSDLKFESIINDKSWKKYTDTFNCLKY